jgi:hypothetical protein
VDIASSFGTIRPGFESHQGVRFLGKHNSAVVNDSICIVCVLKGEIKAVATKIFKKN